VDRPLRKQHPQAQRSAARRGKGIIQRTLATIAKASGARPVGWLGSGLQETWDTLDLLAAEGCEYVCDWTNDDQPYEMSSMAGGASSRCPIVMRSTTSRCSSVRTAPPTNFAR
jgi:Predicted xylanase/chitin deacetylase